MILGKITLFITIYFCINKFEILNHMRSWHWLKNNDKDVELRLYTQIMVKSYKKLFIEEICTGRLNEYKSTNNL